MLRVVFRKFNSSGGSGRSATHPSTNIGLVTIGGSGAHGPHMKLSNPKHDTVDSDRDHHSSEDDESTRQFLQVHVTREVKQETARLDKGHNGVQIQVSAAGRSRHGSALNGAQYN